MHMHAHHVLWGALLTVARRAEDFTYLVFFIGYQYYFAVLKLYALFTLHVTSWGTREGVAGGVKQEKKEVDDEQVQEQRVQMAKKGRMAERTYKRGNIALMRRIHNQKLNDDQARSPAALPPAAERQCVYQCP
jgi:hypothetical protein